MNEIRAMGDDAGSTVDGISRRGFLTAAAGSTALPWLAGAASPSHAAESAPKAASTSGAPNILFILVDQERLFRPGELPADYELPAQRRLVQRGTTFVNHRINSCVCTPSRSVIYTGQ